ncbi:hypothetical protein N7481_011696 [Penicillium waksmanii]|uniref:uncharacterized protein n=1 Tax=Penicillium waksmanii TaxID=69791 RepID=UPI002549528D|nr:uncharacterized protein N7481_011696 [Penicillium waksmanii]KAJ5974486.1 hypothetical protein N7481_011696 [Penicillium waksmanii]
MSRRALVLDGLWYSLCPSFVPRALSRPLPLQQTKKRSSRPFAPASTCTAGSSPRRYYTSGNNVSHNMTGYHSSRAPEASPTHDESLTETESLPTDDVEHYPSATDMLDDRREKELQILYNMAKDPRTHEVCENIPTSFLERKLQEDMAIKPKINDAERLFRVLIRDRQIRPTARHYKALILANCDWAFGSSLAVQRLLDEMDLNNIAMDSGTLHAALQAVAVHPDYILRQQLLDRLRDRWLPLSPAGWHSVVAGLMRENQFEKALEQLEAMERKNIPIENWLHSLIIYILCDYKEFEEISRLVRRRVEQGHDLTPHLLSHVLEKASEDRHHGLTHYIWERKVNLGYLHPSEDTCSRTLSTAAKYGDPQLAQAVFHYIRKAHLAPKSDDYHQLIRSYLASGSEGDLLAGFQELCTVHEAGLKPLHSTMKALYQHFIRHKIDGWEAWQMLKRLKDSERSIPIDAVELILQTWKNDAKHNPSVADDALQLYRELYTVCPDSSNLSIYNSLINICRRAQRVDLGMYMLKEMSSFGIIPSCKTFELVIRMCLDARSFKSAWMYLQDMQEREHPLTLTTQELIQEICPKSVDPYALRLKYHPSAQLPVNPPVAEPAKPNRPGKVVWNKEPKPSQATRKRRRRQREARIAEMEERHEGTVVSEKKRATP